MERNNGRWLIVKGEGVLPLKGHIFSKLATNKLGHSRMNQVKFVEDSFWKVLLGQFLNTLTQILDHITDSVHSSK